MDSDDEQVEVPQKRLRWGWDFEHAKLWLSCTTKENWKFDNRSLYFKNCLYIPEDSHQQLVQLIHEPPTSGHDRFFYTLYLLQKDYWWPSMSTYLWTFSSSCTACQAAKINTYPTIPGLSPLAWNLYPILLHLCWLDHWLAPLCWIWLGHGHGQPWPYEGGNLLPMH